MVSWTRRTNPYLEKWSRPVSGACQEKKKRRIQSKGALFSQDTVGSTQWTDDDVCKKEKSTIPIDKSLILLDTKSQRTSRDTYEVHRYLSLGTSCDQDWHEKRMSIISQQFCIDRILWAQTRPLPEPKNPQIMERCAIGSSCSSTPYLGRIQSTD